MDATGHQWVGALARFNFQLEYQKGWDNTVADALSQSTTHLSPKAVQSILDGVTLGMAHRAEGHDPSVVESDHNVEKEVCVAAGWAQVEVYMTNWAATQKEDLVINAVLNWLGAQKKTNMRTLLGEHASSKEGWMVWRNHQNFTTVQNALYLCSMPKGKNEDLLLFMVPRAHWIAALNGCHWDAGHQGHDHTLSLLQECFWWPGMANRSGNLLGPAHAASNMKAASPRPLYAPLWLLLPWISCMLTSQALRETMLEPNQSPRVANVLVFQDHFTKHMLAYVTPDQTAKTVAKFLYGGYISIFGALARLLSYRGASFISSVIEEMHKILGIKWLQTIPYHPQTNGLVERSHQTIMCMIGKLGEDKKANWPSHLAEIAHVYNATQSAVTRYSPHYLMFRWRPRLLVNFVFPTMGISNAPMREASVKHVDEYVASVWDRLRTALWEAQAQSTREACQQKQYYDKKIGAVNLKPGNLVLVKVDAYKWRRKIKDRWEEVTWEVVHEIATDVPSYEVMNQHRKSHVLHQNRLLLIMSEVGVPLCIGTHHAWDRCTSLTPCKTTSVGGETKLTPQENNGKAVTQRPTSKTSLGWINGKLWLLHGHTLEHPQKMGEDLR